MDPYPFHFVTQGIIINLLPIKGSLAYLTFDWFYIQRSRTCSCYFLLFNKKCSFFGTQSLGS